MGRQIFSIILKIIIIFIISNNIFLTIDIIHIINIIILLIIIINININSIIITIFTIIFLLID